MLLALLTELLACGQESLASSNLNFLRFSDNRKGLTVKLEPFMLRNFYKVLIIVQLLHVPHLHPDLPDRDDVLDLFLDQAGGGAGPSHAGGHFSANPLHPARQQPEVAPARLLHKGHRHVHVFLHTVRLFQSDRVRHREQSS